jgi:DNA invertase Pin-like site-specific DNA recombinase
LVLRDFVSHQDWHLIEEYIDHESGLKSTRSEFKKMLKDASKRKFDVVIFWALDRFSREGTKKTLSYLSLLESYGIGFRSYSEQYIDSTGIFKDAVIGILAAVANMESVRRGDRVKAGMERARSQGKKISRPPLPEKTRAKIRTLTKQNSRTEQLHESLV